MDGKTIISDAKAEYTWIQKHERIVLVFMVLFVGCFLGNKWINYSAANADARYAAIEQRLVEREKLDEVNAKQTALVTSQYQTMVDMLAKQNLALNNTINARNTELKKKQEQITSMTLPEVAHEWEKTLGLPVNALPIQGASVVVSEPAARQTVTELAKVPFLEANLSDTWQLVENGMTEAAKANEVISSQVTEITGLKETNVLQGQNCEAQINDIKAKARKSKRNFFIAGFIAGIATRLFVKF